MSGGLIPAYGASPILRPTLSYIKMALTLPRVQQVNKLCTTIKNLGLAAVVDLSDPLYSRHNDNGTLDSKGEAHQNGISFSTLYIL